MDFSAEVRKVHHPGFETWILSRMRTVLGQKGTVNAPPQRHRISAEPPRNWGGSVGLFLCQFLPQADTNSHALNETRTLVIPAEDADWIQDRVHLPQGHAVH